MHPRGAEGAQERLPTRQIYSTPPHAPSHHSFSYPNAQIHPIPSWTPQTTPQPSYPLYSMRKPYQPSSVHYSNPLRPAQHQFEQFLEPPKSATTLNHSLNTNASAASSQSDRTDPCKKRRNVVVNLPVKDSSGLTMECGGSEEADVEGAVATGGDRRRPLLQLERRFAHDVDVDEYRFATERATTRGPHRDEVRLAQLPPTIDIYLPGKSSWSDAGDDIARLNNVPPPILEQLSKVIAAAPQVDIFSPLPSPSFAPASSFPHDRRTPLLALPSIPLRTQEKDSASQERSLSASSSTSIGTVLRTFLPPPHTSPATSRNGRSLTLEELTRGFGLDVSVVLSPGATTWKYSTNRIGEQSADSCDHSSPSTAQRRRRQNHSYSSEEGAYDGSDSNCASSGIEDALGEEASSPQKGQHQITSDFSFPPRSPTTPLSKFSRISPTTIRQRPLDPAVDSFRFVPPSKSGVRFSLDDSTPPHPDTPPPSLSLPTTNARRTSTAPESTLFVTPPKPVVNARAPAQAHAHASASSHSDTSHMDSPYSVRLATIVGQQPTSSAMSVSRSLPIHFGPPLLDRRGSLADYSPSISRPRGASVVDMLMRTSESFPTNFDDSRRWTIPPRPDTGSISPPRTNPSDALSSPPSSQPSHLDIDLDDAADRLLAPLQVLGDFVAQQFDSLRDQVAETFDLVEIGIPDTLELFRERLGDLLADSRTLDEEGRESMLAELRLVGNRIAGQAELVSRNDELMGEVAALERRVLHQDQRITQLQIDKIELQYAAKDAVARYALLESRLAESEKTRLVQESAFRHQSSSNHSLPNQRYQFAVDSIPSPPASPEVNRSRQKSFDPTANPCQSLTARPPLGAYS